jgi:hypothetical protein
MPESNANGLDRDPQCMKWVSRCTFPVTSPHRGSRASCIISTSVPNAEVLRALSPRLVLKRVRSSQAEQLVDGHDTKLWQGDLKIDSFKHTHHQPAGHMRRFAALATLACSPQGEATGSINACTAELFPAYNPKVLDQCVAVCKKCDHGITTTCTTSCTLKGAH